MRYYFTTPERFLESLKSYKTNDYTLLYNWLMAPINQKLDYYFSKDDELLKQYNFFILESCRYFIDGKDYDTADHEVYQDLIRSARNLLIDRAKVEKYFKEYINDLFSNKKNDRKPPSNVSEVVIDLMLSELSMVNAFKHINLGTQEVDLKSIQDAVKLEKINFIKRLIHDRVLFFIEYYENCKSR